MCPTLIVNMIAIFHHLLFNKPDSITFKFRPSVSVPNPFAVDANLSMFRHVQSQPPNNDDDDDDDDEWCKFSKYDNDIDNDNVAITKDLCSNIVENYMECVNKQTHQQMDTLRDSTTPNWG